MKVEEFEHKGLKIEIHKDDDPVDPREGDNLGTMICFHPRYRLGDDNREYSKNELLDIVQQDGVIALPLFLYDHGGITMSTREFSCPWDSGQVGFIFVTPDRIQEEFGKIDAETLGKAKNILEAEVETYDQYLTGEVFGFVIKNDEDIQVDSCWGIFDKKYCIEEAKHSI